MIIILIFINIILILKHNSGVTLFNVTDEIFDPAILEFIISQNEATIYHHPAWLKALERSFGFNVYYLIAKNELGEIEGLTPFLAASSPITGKRIITLPFSTYCDPLIDYKRLPDAIKFLKEKFQAFSVIDIRSLNNYQNYLSDFSVSSEYCTHILKLKNAIEETFESFHPTSIRASIRRAEKNNLSIDWGDSFDHLKIFYQLEFKLRKRLLLPPIPFNFFKNFYEELKKYDLITIPIVYKDNIPVSAGFILNYKDKFYLEYTASDKDYLYLYPNHKLFFEVIKKAHNSGAKFVDFGRTNLENISLITFKEKWAAEKYPVFHHLSPKRRFIKKENKFLKKTLMKINAALPDFILKLEGDIIYKHLL